METGTTITTIPKDILLGIIRENREKHRSVFEAALEGYSKQARVILEDL